MTMVISPVTYTHELVDLAGKLHWHTQRADIDAMEITINLLRRKIIQIKKFINEYEVES